MSQHTLIVCSLILLILFFQSHVSAKYMQVCNLQKGALLQPVFSSACNTSSISIMVQPGSRVKVVSGPSPSKCGVNYYVANVFDIESFVDASNLCEISPIFRPGDIIYACNVPHSASFLAVYPTPVLSGPYYGLKFPNGAVAEIVGDPVYSVVNKEYSIKIKFTSDVIGYVPTSAICLPP